MIQENFNERLLRVIKASEYKNVARLARRMDIDRKAVDNWVKGNSFPSASHTAEICCIFHVSPDWLLCGKGTPHAKYSTEDALIQQDFTERLTKVIKESEFSCIARVARKLDVDRKSLTRWTKGDSMPNAYHLAKLCSLLNITAKWLLYGKTEEKGKREVETHEV